MADGEKNMSIKVIIGAVVVVLLLCGGISYFVVAHVMNNNNPNDKKNAQREPGVFLKLGDPREGLILNIGNVTSGRYIKIGLVLEMKPDKNAEAKTGKTLSPEEVKIQDTVIRVLRLQRTEDFEPNKQEQLKELLKNEINASLGSEKVYEVYITNFMLQ